jgi:hypothetical protein
MSDTEPWDTPSQAKPVTPTKVKKPTKHQRGASVPGMPAWLAPEGQCVSCDYRREQGRLATKLSRERKRRAASGGGGAG